jgi:hypothetical protein
MRTLSGIKELGLGIIRSIQGGRLQYTSDSTLSWVPFKHGSIALWTGSAWSIITLNTAVNFLNTERDYFGSNLSYDVNYDVYAQYINKNLFKLQLLPWASSNTRAYSLDIFNGVWVSSLDHTLRFLGAVRLYNSSGPVFIDTLQRRFIVNWNNRLDQCVSCTMWGTTLQRVSAITWTEFQAMTRGEFLSLDPLVGFMGETSIYISASYLPAGNQFFDTSMALNSTTNVVGIYGSYYSNNWDTKVATSLSYGSPLLGYNWITLVAKQTSASNWSDIHPYSGEIGKCMVFIPT